MPFKSQAQRRLFYAVAGGKKTKTKGLSSKEAEKFIEHSRHQKSLIEKVSRKLKKVRKSVGRK